MNIFRLLGDLSHLISILILLHKMTQTNSCAGISFKSQALYFIVYATRYFDIFWTFTDSAYNTIYKILFLCSSGYTIYLMTTAYRPTTDPGLDTIKVQYILLFSAVLGALFPYYYTPYEMTWAFSIWLESVAIIPQLVMVQRTGEAETITAHYLFALGVYRALYIPNWIWRYWAEGHSDWISVVAGILQTLLYADFFWIYYTKVMKGKKFALPV
ncbi:ER lumen protein-retaining receptor [Lachnellula suecica]|uniref:ER lumen protein-retaining receptor n=1 Tax=Lachnellula suecica TaxID=602035 RepID=A0A8T9C8A6_9HELO|nr:ER lumen protein-retaining receptor [Lachnellula suecica]